MGPGGLDPPTSRLLVGASNSRVPFEFVAATDFRNPHTAAPIASNSPEPCGARPLREIAVLEIGAPPDAVTAHAAAPLAT